MTKLLDEASIQREGEIDQALRALSRPNPTTEGIPNAVLDLLRALLADEKERASATIKWVRDAIKEGFPRASETLKPLLTLDGIPPFPTEEIVNETVYQNLTREVVAYMMDPLQYPFRFQISLVTPDFESLLKMLLIERYKEYSGANFNPEAQYFYSGLLERRHIQRFFQKKPDITAWRWEFYQDRPVTAPQRWDNVNVALDERFDLDKKQRPHGVTGTDRFTWVTCASEGLRTGQPFDVQDLERRHGEPAWAQAITIFDEEGVSNVNGKPFAFAGHFDTMLCRGSLKGGGYPNIRVCAADTTNFRSAVFRHSVRGLIPQ